MSVKWTLEKIKEWNETADQLYTMIFLEIESTSSVIPQSHEKEFLSNVRKALYNRPKQFDDELEKYRIDYDYKDPTQTALLIFDKRLKEFEKNRLNLRNTFTGMLDMDTTRAILHTIVLWSDNYLEKEKR